MSFGAPVQNGVGVGLLSYATLLARNSGPTISGPLTAFTAGLAGSTSATVSPSGTAVTIISVTNGGVSDTLAAHNVVHDGFGTFTTTGAIL